MNLDLKAAVTLAFVSPRVWGLLAQNCFSATLVSLSTRLIVSGPSSPRCVTTAEISIGFFVLFPAASCPITRFIRFRYLISLSLTAASTAGEGRRGVVGHHPGRDVVSQVQSPSEELQLGEGRRRCKVNPGEVDQQLGAVGQLDGQVQSHAFGCLWDPLEGVTNLGLDAPKR